jgi:hypothetical protein
MCVRVIRSLALAATKLMDHELGQGRCGGREGGREGGGLERGREKVIHNIHTRQILILTSSPLPPP